MAGRELRAEVETAVSVPALASWMSSQGLGEGPIRDLAEIGGGSQNVLVRFSRDGRDYVLRRGPLHLRPNSNRAIAREVRVLQALRETDVPHPRLIAACGNPAVLAGAIFYLMEPVHGFNATVELPALHAGNRSIRHAMCLALVDALAALGAVDHETVGLADFGRPDGFLERQVPRWLSELDSYRAFENYPGADLPGVGEVAAWLERHRPSQFSPGIMHGDFHIANAMFSRSGPSVMAIVDWEMCTIGDPLMDLGWLLATWQLPGAAWFGEGVMMLPGLATAEELIARYTADSRRDLSAVPWYRVLACFKLGILLEGSLARASAGLAPEQVGRRLHANAVHLFERALEQVSTS
jgi:aminoglycoside phosphotransferase (APT) family kinase protein